MYFTSIIFYRSSTKFPGQSNAQRLFQATTNWWKIPTDWSQKCGLQSKPQRFDRKYWTGNSKFQLFNETPTSDAKEISNKNVNFCNNNRWGLYYYAGLWPAFLCFSLVQIFLCSYCCLFITSFSCDIEQVFDKKLREGVSYVSLDDANKTHSLFFFLLFSASPGTPWTEIANYALSRENQRWGHNNLMVKN